MTFEASSSVTLLFDFWAVHGPAEMVLSVCVVLLVTVLYQLLKVWRLVLSSSVTVERDRSSEQENWSKTPLTAVGPQGHAPTAESSWRRHSAQAMLHVLQVSVGYLLMLCIMSYNTWIFLGIVTGSVLGYFFCLPLLGHG